MTHRIRGDVLSAHLIVHQENCTSFIMIKHVFFFFFKSARGVQHNSNLWIDPLCCLCKTKTRTESTSDWGGRKNRIFKYALNIIRGHLFRLQRPSQSGLTIPSLIKASGRVLSSHCTVAPEGKISVGGEHILQCDVDLVSSPSCLGPVFSLLMLSKLFCLCVGFLYVALGPGSGHTRMGEGGTVNGDYCVRPAGS